MRALWVIINRSLCEVAKRIYFRIDSMTAYKLKYWNAFIQLKNCTWTVMEKWFFLLYYKKLIIINSKKRRREKKEIIDRESVECTQPFNTPIAIYCESPLKIYIPFQSNYFRIFLALWTLCVCQWYGRAFAKKEIRFPLVEKRLTHLYTEHIPDVIEYMNRTSLNSIIYTHSIILL